MPTQSPIRQKKETDYRKHVVLQTDVQAREWLTYLSHKPDSEGVDMRHKYNSGEKTSGRKKT